MPDTSRLRKISLHSPITLIMALILACSTSLAYANNYTRIVVFGDSLSDTGNFAHLTQDQYGVRIPGPIADYTDGRFTDGVDTFPAAQKFFGVWIEQLAASMPLHPEVKNSLDGGTNYAYGLALTGNGTSVQAFGPDNSLSITVENMGLQITEYLATKPKIDKSTLFVIWGGANNLLSASSVDDVVNAAIEETLDMQRLIDAGATQFLVLNLPPLGSTPRLNGSLATSVTANAASLLFNAWLVTGVSVLRDFYAFRHVSFSQLDVYTLFNQIAAQPGKFALANITASALGNPGIDPDTYLFWDDIHPTTRGHNIVAGAAMQAIAPSRCESLGLLGCL